MLGMTSYLYDFVLENTRFFNEYDRSSFIANATVALNKAKADLSLSLNETKYSEMLAKSILHINKIEIDSYAISEFITKILNSGRVDSAKLSMIDLSNIQQITLKPQYLMEALNDFKSTINDIADGKFDIGDIKNKYANIDAYTDTLKKRIISSNLKINVTPKDMLNYDAHVKTAVTTKYLEDEVIPFLENIPKTKKNLVAEMMNVNTVVSTVISELNRTLENISIGISLDKLDEAQIKPMMMYAYNQARSIMEAVSFLTYAAMRKIHQFEDCVTECQNVYNTLTLVFNDNTTLIEAGTFDKKVITATDAHNMVEKLVDGDVDVFEELASNILEYHKGYVATHVNLDAGNENEYLTTVLSKTEYDPSVYEELVKCYIEIGNGLDIIAKNCDDRLAIFDEILNKSGFVISLLDRFQNQIRAIEDLNQYAITDLNLGDNGVKETVYYKILAEIADYPRLMRQIANTAKDIRIKAEYIEDLFNRKQNGELGYSETMNELKLFLNSFTDQYRAMNTEIVKGLYLRLKLLASKADDCTDNVYSTPESELYTDEDFYKEAVIADLDEMDAYNDLLMEKLVKEYYAERELLERGVQLVYEAENTTAVTVVDNDASGSKAAKSAGAMSKGGLAAFVNSISEWFEKVKESFLKLIDRQKEKNMEWLAANKQGLMDRSYSNVEIQILPYDKYQVSGITQDISKLANNIRNMTVANMQNIKSYEDVRARLINFGINFNNNTDEKVVITNHYKTGSNATEVATYSNSAVKTYITSHMIPYCETFYTTFQDQILNALDGLKTAMEDITKTYVSESTNNILNTSIFTEAESDAQTNGDASITQKAGWIKQCVRTYYGSVLNAIRDRNTDYFKVLYALAPKPDKTATTADTSEQTEQEAK